MDKFEKIIQLHRILTKNKRPLPLSHLCERLECSKATFHRLRSYMANTLGAPLIFDYTYGGYRYDCASGDRFELPGLWLTCRETEALLGFYEAITSLQHGFLSELFAPVKKQFTRFLRSQNIASSPGEGPLRIIPALSCEIDNTLFRTLADAVIRKRTVIIGHNKAREQTVETRTVSPVAVIRYRDNWYLDAYCHLRKELRTFSLSRIQSAALSAEPFHVVSKKMRETFYADAYGIFNGPARFTAQIRFTGIAVQIVAHEQWHPGQQGRLTPEGHYLLTLPYGDDRELIMDILKWGDHAEVISPPELRSKVKSLLINTLRNY